MKHIFALLSRVEAQTCHAPPLIHLFTRRRRAIPARPIAKRLRKVGEGASNAVVVALIEVSANVPEDLTGKEEKRPNL